MFRLMLLPLIFFQIPCSFHIIFNFLCLNFFSLVNLTHKAWEEQLLVEAVRVIKTFVCLSEQSQK